MIDPKDPPAQQILKQQRIIDALIRRAEQGTQMDGGAFGLFNSAMALQNQVWAKTKDLEQALDTLGAASTRLESAEEARRAVQQNLADAVEAMESGFALFSGGKLQICNQLFRTFLPDLARRIRMGMTLDRYLDALMTSRFVLPHGADTPDARLAGPLRDLPGRSWLLPIQGDRWFQVTLRDTSSGNTVVLLTEVTGVIRRNRIERDTLIDDQARFLQTAFDHMNVGVATLSDEGMLLQTNARFRALLDLPIALADPGTVLPQILSYLHSQRLLRGMSGPIDFTHWLIELLGPEDMLWPLRHANGAVLEVSLHLLPGGSRMITVRDTSAENAAKALLEERVASRTQDLTVANDLLTRQNAELEETRQQLTEACDRAEAAVRSKTRFLAAASHDLLQPVNAAKLLLSILEDQAAGGALAQTVTRLSRSFESLDMQLNALLDISRLDSTGVEYRIDDFPLQALLRQVEADTAPVAAQKGLKLRILPCPHWVRSDQRYLTRSVQNLVLNALQYTESGGVLLGCRRRGDRISIEVWDSGIGIDPADEARIFDAFIRVNPDHDTTGMGLGLSIVDRACRQLCHPVTLRSRPGKGSVFRIDVPRVPARALPAPGEVSHDADPVAEDLIIVVVEDDPGVRQATTQRLEDWGASVLAAGSTAEAQALVAEIGIAPDLLIVDYQLGGQDNGVAAISALRAQTGQALPAIMITATRSNALQETASAQDFTILTKPVPLTRLRPLINWKTRACRQKDRVTAPAAPIG